MRYLNQTFGGRSAGHVHGAGVHNVGTHLNFHLATATALGPGLLGARRSPKSGTSRYYSVDIGLVHIVVLDLNAYYFPRELKWIAPQLSWLKRDLAAAAANRAEVPWILLVSHYPLYCSSNSMLTHNDGQGEEDTPELFAGCWSYGISIPKVRHDLEPLMEKYKVDLYFAGHGKKAPLSLYSIIPCSNKKYARA